MIKPTALFARQRLFVSGTIVLLIAGFLAGWAFWWEPSSLIVKQYTLNIKEWNPAFDRYKIVAISDVHGGGNFITETKIQEIVRQANAQQPDLIVLLGDYVDQQRGDRRKIEMPMNVIADNLRNLRAKHGVYAVIGNHDIWYSATDARAQLERIGIRVLENEAVAIEQNGGTLRLLGLPDAIKVPTWQPYADNAKAALEKVDATGDVIVLTHNPDAFAYINQTNPISDDFRLMLAGHTHGGQVRFPLIGAPIVPSTFRQRFARGHIIENGKHLFVTTGIGTSILPVRFGVPPEISVLTIVAD